MQSYNTFTACGNIINPESKAIETQNGTRQMFSWSMAFNDPMDRQNKDKTSWIRCVAWGRPAEVLEEYCTEVDPESGKLIPLKGAAVAITGPLVIQKWVDRQGNKGTTVQVNVQTFQLIGSNPNNNNNNEENGNQPDGNKVVAKALHQRSEKAKPQPKLVASEPIDLDSLPF